MAIFDRTFRITEVLRILAGVVAFLGLASAVMSIELERGRELAVLRALGLRPRQVRALTLVPGDAEPLGDVTNPATGEVIARVPFASASQAN